METNLTVVIKTYGNFCLTHGRCAVKQTKIPVTFSVIVLVFGNCNHFGYRFGLGFRLGLELGLGLRLRLGIRLYYKIAARTECAPSLFQFFYRCTVGTDSDISDIVSNMPLSKLNGLYQILLSSSKSQVVVLHGSIVVRYWVFYLAFCHRTASGIRLD